MFSKKRTVYVEKIDHIEEDDPCYDDELDQISISERQVRNLSFCELIKIPCCVFTSPNSVSLSQ